MAQLPATPTFKRAKLTEQAIDSALLADRGNKFRQLLLKHLPRVADAYRQEENSAGRAHLGASQIGIACERALWLGWRWAGKKEFPARILRLFNRGHLEEARFLALLEMIGVEFHQPAGNEQERISDHGGHFGSALDGVLYGVPDLPEEWVLGEFKTHNTKSFCDLTNKGVKIAKPEHYAQIQVCMARRGIYKTLYVAVNKNDDDIFAQMIAYEDMSATHYLNRASKIITRREAPARISDDPSNFGCSFCDFKNRCHYPAAEPVAKNCRTCRNSVATLDGLWNCELLCVTLDKEAQRAGCGKWEALPDLVKR